MKYCSCVKPRALPQRICRELTTSFPQTKYVPSRYLCFQSTFMHCWRKVWTRNNWIGLAQHVTAGQLSWVSYRKRWTPFTATSLSSSGGKPVHVGLSAGLLLYNGRDENPSYSQFSLCWSWPVSYTAAVLPSILLNCSSVTCPSLQRWFSVLRAD